MLNQPKKSFAVVMFALASIFSTLASADYLTELQADTVQHLWKLDETSGTTANDTAGVSTLDLTYEGSPSLNQSGYIPSYGAVDFNGTTQDAKGNQSTGYDPNAGSFTFECVINPDTTTGQQIIISARSVEGGSCNGTIQTSFLFFRDGTHLRWYIGRNEGDNGCQAWMDLTSSTALSTSTWYIVAGRYRKTSALVDIFLNGVNDGTSTTTAGSGPATTWSSSNLVIGGEVVDVSDNVGAFWDGKIQWCSHFNTNLSDARILAHYNAALTVNGLPIQRRRIFQSARTWFPPGWLPPTFEPDAPHPYVLNDPTFEVDRLNKLAVRSPSQY